MSTTDETTPAELSPEDMAAQIAEQEKIPEMTPEEKLVARRTATLADMIVSFRQEIEGIDMNLERLAIHKMFWQRRLVETKDKDGESYKKAEESLMNISKQVADLKLAKRETENFIVFLDEAMQGKVTINYGEEVKA